MSLFGAARLYVMCVDRIERDLAPSDGGTVPPRHAGAWALWATTGAPPREVDAQPPVWRVQSGPVRLARRRSVRA